MGLFCVGLLTNPRCADAPFFLEIPVHASQTNQLISVQDEEMLKCILLHKKKCKKETGHTEFVFKSIAILLKTYCLSLAVLWKFVKVFRTFPED